MKRLLLLVLVLLLLVCACSPKETVDGDNNDTSDTVVQGDATPSSVPDESGEITAIRVGGVEITSNEYRYHYYSTVQYFISFYGSYMGIDESKPLEEQYYDEESGVTWADFFAEQSVAGVRNSVLLSEQAKAMGMALEESYKSQISSQIDELKSMCESNGTTMEAMLKTYYGGSMNENSLREIMERTYLGYQFEMYKRDSVDVSDSALQNYYDLHAGEFDSVDYISYSFESAEEAEKCLAAITDEESFYKYIKDNFDEDLENYLTIGDGNNLDEVSEWLFSDDRKEGDAAVVEAYDVFMVVFFKQRYQSDDESLSIRHILISSEGSTAEEAHARAQTLYDEWKSGAATEESFAVLAMSNTDDTGSVQSGGLYEDVYEGQMVEEFDKWCFDPARKNGDTGLVDTQYGTHIMYFTGYVLSWKSQVKQAYVEEVYSEFYEGLLGKYEVEQINMNVAK